MSRLPTKEELEVINETCRNGGSLESALDAINERGARRDAKLADVDAEYSLLGGIIEQGYGMKATGVMPNDCTLVEHQLMVAAILGLEEAGIAINVVTLADRLDASECKELDEAGRGEYFEGLRSKYGFNCRMPGGLESYAGIIRDKADRRRLMGWADELKESACNGKAPAETARQTIGKLEGMAKAKTGPQETKVSQMKRIYNGLRLAVIFGLLRVGETMNIIAATGIGKSWLVIQLALSVATGEPFLGFRTAKGKVLIIDNECHGETINDRIPQVADTLPTSNGGHGIQLADYDDNLGVISLRGHLMDIHGIVAMLLANYKAGDLQVVIIDALYRALPKGTSENDNGAMAEVYNAIDQCALELGCAFVVIHHSSKGNQSSKSVTDTGAGAGAQSRATDTHLIMREHEEPGVYVNEAKVRSWGPLPPFCTRRTFPIWEPVEGPDPTALKRERPSRRTKKDTTEGKATTDKPVWTVATYKAEFITAEPSTEGSILARATAKGLSLNMAKELLKCAKGLPDVHAWRFGPRIPNQYATVAQPALPLEGELNTPELPKKRGRPKRQNNVSCVVGDPPSTPQEIP